MSVAGQLYKLQQLDLDLQKKQQELSEVENQLSDNKALVAAESRLASQKEQLEEARKKQKSSEWELDDLQEKSDRLMANFTAAKRRIPRN